MKAKLNPILSKELRVRMRSFKAPLMIAVYMSILMIITCLMLYNTILNPYNYRINSTDIVSSYAVIAGIEFLLIAFIVPALTAGAISGERERQTLDLLLCTKLRPLSIIMGKISASISQVILLIIAALPVFSIMFLFGGISFKEIAQLFLYYIVLAVTLASIGIFFSVYVKKTTTSTVLTYSIILFLLLGTLIITIFYISIKTRNNPQNTQNITLPLLYFNPGAGYISLIAEQFGLGNEIIGGVKMYSSSKNIPPLWIVNIIIDIIISAVLIILSSLKLNPMKKVRIRK